MANSMLVLIIGFVLLAGIAVTLAWRLVVSNKNDLSKQEQMDLLDASRVSRERSAQVSREYRILKNGGKLL